MALYLSKTKDQALMALAVREARAFADDQGDYVGRTAMQKMGYFMKRKGVPLTYRFDLYHYGPFCAEIHSDIECLLVDDVILETSAKPRNYSNYAPGKSIDELLDRHSSIVEENLAAVRAVVRALVPLKPEHLELIATLDFLFQQEIAKELEGDVRKVVIERFVKLKPRFTREEVESTYDALEKGGLLMA